MGDAMISNGATEKSTTNGKIYKYVYNVKTKVAHSKSNSKLSTDPIMK